jgi:hypothetical protein
MKWIEEHFKRPEPKPKGWVTINDIIVQTGNNRKTVESRIKEMVTRGDLVSMDCIDNGKRAKCYKYKK